VDIFAITETFLDSSISDAEICPVSYQMCHHDRSRHGGGVLIFLHDSLQVIPHWDLSNFCDELLWLEIAISVGPVIIIHQLRVLITL